MEVKSVISKIKTTSFTGIDVNDVEIQTHVGPGLPSFNIVGLANKAIAESKERVRVAFSSIGLALPQKRITVNLSPADIQKDGTHFDLPIALSLLVSMSIIPQEEINHYIIMGELALGGDILKVPGILPAAIAANKNDMGIVCPHDNSNEALFSGNDAVLAPRHILEIINHFTGKKGLIQPKIKDIPECESSYLDMQDVVGQPLARKALEIAAAGRHNMLMIGPPGSGKSMLAKRICGLLPHLSPSERLESSIIASIAGQLNSDTGLVSNIRPFRSPHSSSSMAAMIGGGKDAKPGEITLAHNGVLFLDELPEFQRNVLEAMRQPTEDGEISIARVNMHVKYPSNFQLIAAMNPCKCGYYGSAHQEFTCRKAPVCVMDYQNKVSGPMMDRFDIQVETTSMDPAQIHKNNANAAESSAAIAERVMRAHEIQKQRCQSLGIVYKANSQIESNTLHEITQLDRAGQALIEKASVTFGLSMRGVNRILKVARTIADLEGVTGPVSESHIAEATTYRITRIKS